MACGRKLDPVPGFTRPKWEKLDVLKHAEHVHETFFAVSREFPWKPDPRPWIDRLKEALGRGMELEIARVDPNGDGKLENLLRIGGSQRPCSPQEQAQSSGGRKRMVIVDSALAKVEATLIPEDDIFLCQGKVCSDALYGYGFGEEVRQKRS